MCTRLIGLAMLLTIPTMSEAQRTNRGRELFGDWNQPDTAMGRPAPSIKKSDIEKFSGVLIVVDKKKDLKLSDDVTNKLKDLGKQEEAYNQPLYQKADSLRLAIRRRAGEDGEKEQVRMTLARQELLEVIRQIRSNYDSTFQVGLPLLDETQKAAATQLVEKQRDEAEDDLRSKLGGRGGGGVRPAGRARRP